MQHILRPGTDFLWAIIITLATGTGDTSPGLIPDHAEDIAFNVDSSWQSTSHLEEDANLDTLHARQATCPPSAPIFCGAVGRRIRCCLPGTKCVSASRS